MTDLTPEARAALRAIVFDEASVVEELVEQREAEPVSREACASAGDRKRRRYHSPAKAAMGQAAREAVFSAALAFIAAGVMRPERRELGKVAGYSEAIVAHHFGTLDLFYRQLVRERWREIALVLGLATLPGDEQRRLAWLIVAGCPEPA